MVREVEIAYNRRRAADSETEQVADCPGMGASAPIGGPAEMHTKTSRLDRNASDSVLQPNPQPARPPNRSVIEYYRPLVLKAKRTQFKRSATTFSDRKVFI